MLHHGRVLCLLGALGSAPALESKVVTVSKVVDGGTILVGGLGDAVDVKVQLSWMFPADRLTVPDAANKKDNQHTKKGLLALLPPETRVRLWIPDPKSGAAPDFSKAIILTGKSGKRSVQESLIREGLALYDTTSGKAPDEWDKLFSDTTQGARKSKAGAWSTAHQQMADWADQKR